MDPLPLPVLGVLLPNQRAENRKEDPEKELLKLELIGQVLLLVAHGLAHIDNFVDQVGADFCCFEVFHYADDELLGL